MLGLFSAACEQRLLLTSDSDLWLSRGTNALLMAKESLPCACVHVCFMLFDMARNVLVAVLDWNIKQIYLYVKVWLVCKCMCFSECLCSPSRFCKASICLCEGDIFRVAVFVNI